MDEQDISPIIVYRIPGIPVPKKNNRRITKSQKSLPSVRFLLWQSYAIEVLGQYRKPHPPLTYVKKLEIIFGMPDMRNRDTDNIDTSVKDMLVKANVLVDDNWKVLPNSQVRGVYSPDLPFTYIKIIGGRCD